MSFRVNLRACFGDHVYQRIRRAEIREYRAGESRGEARGRARRTTRAGASRDRRGGGGKGRVRGVAGSHEIVWLDFWSRRADAFTCDPDLWLIPFTYPAKREQVKRRA